VVEGEQSYCGSCHDGTPGYNGGIAAFDLMGDNSTYGFYITGHGKASGNYPVMYYQDGGDTGNPCANQSCDNCHNLTSAHFNPSGKRLLAGYANDQDNSNCNQCHPPGTVATALPVLYPDSAEYEAATHGGILCSQCHEVHGAAADADPAMAKDGKRDLCFGCHYSGNPGDLPIPLSPPAEHTDSVTACSTCHNPHKPSHGEGISGDGCIECHGHDSGTNYDPDGQEPYTAGGTASQGKGSYKSHSTHTELDTDDARGPGIYCDSCHDINNFPYFKSGTDSNGDLKYDLSETDVCDTCHSPGGSYDGLSNADIGAKNNWDSGVYTGTNLIAGKETWCATCHDESPSQIQGIFAPNVVGDEDNSGGEGIYGAWGYYRSGHGLPSGSTYPSSGGVTTGADIGCLDCHVSTASHIDGAARSFDCGDGCDSTEYRLGYRLHQVSGNDPMGIPWTGLGGSDATKFRLCIQTGCHDPGPFTDPENFNTNFASWSPVEVEPDVWQDVFFNRHEYHLSFSNQNRYYADYNFGGTLNSRINCVVCHNVHGSGYLAMVRNGKLINREPGLKVWYHDDPDGGDCCEGAVTWQTINPDPPDPEELPLSASTGMIWRGLTSANLCSHCHANNNTIAEYRTPYQNVSQIPTLDWTGEPNYESDGVDPDSALAESTFYFRIEYTDTNNDAPASIQVWVDENDNLSYEEGEKYDMFELDGGDINYTDGKIYTGSLTISKAGDNTFNYRFYAHDGSEEATGDPVSGSTLSVTDNGPELDWTGQTYYAGDGVHPDTGGSGASFEFRVEYTDLDNEAPALIQMWIDEDEDLVYQEDEKHDMSVFAGEDGNYANGEIYTVIRTLSFTNDGVYNYRFHATSDGADASGDPASDSTVTVTESTNNAPLLEWHSTDCLTEGARPYIGGDNTTYEFWVKYTDSDNDAPSTIQVWVDVNDNDVYDDPDERYDMTVEGGDGDYTNGEIYKKSLVIPYNGDGILKYSFLANDGVDDATGTPVSDSTLTVLNSAVVRPSGSSLYKDYTSINTAVQSETGTIIVVYPNDDFTAATYSEKIVMIWSSGHDLTIQSVCGADLTILSSNDGGTTVSVQDVSNFTVDGLSITGATSANGIYVNRPDNTPVIIRNSKVYGNSTGLYINDADDIPVQIENAEIYNNSGRGIFAVSSDDDFNLVGCDLHSHNVSIAGAAIYINSGGTYTISKSVIRDNLTTADGGAIYLNGGSMTIENSIFADNQGSNGGVIRSNNGPTLNIVNSTFADNTATGYGGFIYMCALGNHTVRNSIFWNNTATSDGDVGYKACGSVSGYITITDSSVSTSGSNFGGGTPTVSDNLTPAEDPLFVNAAADDYHIQPVSPVIDGASETYAPADDIDGDARVPVSGKVDMGADELP
jgi:predicted CXXCH cytochrome family protein